MSKQKPKNATIRDVAELVGVHHSTVSRALNPDQRRKISPEVVREIQKAADKLGYLPNIAASSLKRNRSFAVGVLIPDITNSVFPPIIRGIQDVAGQEGFTVLIANTDNDVEKERDAVRMMRGRAIEGIILATARLDDPTVDECVKNGIPLVLINRNSRRDDVGAVIIDEDYGVRTCLDHLLELGHSRIAHIAGPTETSTGHERLQAFQSYMKLHRLDSQLIEEAARYTVDDGRKACNTLLNRDDSFTAILAGNDLLALGCIDSLSDAGKTVPDDVSVVGGNDIPMLERMMPPLTTNHIPKYQMGCQATSMLIEKINNESVEPVVLRMQPRLVVRKSTGPADSNRTLAQL